MPSAARGMSAGLLLLSLGRAPAIIDRLFAPPVVRGIQLGLGIILLQGGLQLVVRDQRLPAGAGTAGVGGLIWGALTLPAALPPVSLGPALALPVLPTAAELGTALAVLVLPQLPPTLGNSVVSTAAVAQEYFGERAVRGGPRTLLRDMGPANLAAGPGGGAPPGHGRGRARAP